MEPIILNYLYNLCLESTKERVNIPSVRQFALKFKLSKNDVQKTLNFWKEQNILVTEQGSKSFLMRSNFLSVFKNDTFLMFGTDVKRKIIKKSIKKLNNKYEYKFVREFIKDDKIVSLSIDYIYTYALHDINIDQGVDAFIRQKIKGKKTAFKKMRVIDITKMEEYKKLNCQFCALVETKIVNAKHEVISHSFSATPINYYKNFTIEMMI